MKSKNPNNLINFIHNYLTWFIIYFGLFSLIVFVAQINKIDLKYVSALLIVSLPFSLIQVLKNIFIPSGNFGKSLLLLFSILLLRGFFIPVTGWDSYSMYDGRAQMFLKGATWSDFVGLSKYDTQNSLYYFSYPPLTSNLHLLSYTLGLPSPMYIYALYYLAYIGLVYLLISGINIPSLFKTFLIFIASVPPLIVPHISVAYTNLPMVVYQIASIYFLIKTQENRNIINYLLFGVCLSLSLWTRSTEPTYILFIIISIFYTPKLHWLFIGSSLPVLLSLYWSNFVKQLVGSKAVSTTLNYSLNLSIITSGMYLGHLLKVFQYVLFSLRPILIYIIIFWLIATLKQQYRKSMIYWLIVLYQIYLLAGTFYLSINYSWWNQIPDSLLRSSLVLIPLIIIFIADSLSFENEKSI